MNTSRIAKISTFSIVITILSSCGLISQDKHINAITTTHMIFLDSNLNANSKNVDISIDSTIPQLREITLQKLKDDGIKIVDSNANSNANVVLKVKTKFHGEILSKHYQKTIEDEVSFENIEQLPKPEKEKEKYQRTTIDQLIEDPSGMIIGFAIGASTGTPIIGAPIGMAIGAALNISFSHLFAPTEILTILEVEVHEKAKQPIWYNDKRIHQKDEYSIRKYDFSEQTNWKVYKTRIIVRTKRNDRINFEEIANRISSFVI